MVHDVLLSHPFCCKISISAIQFVMEQCSAWREQLTAAPIVPEQQSMHKYFVRLDIHLLHTS